MRAVFLQTHMMICHHETHEFLFKAVKGQHFNYMAQSTTLQSKEITKTQSISGWTDILGQMAIIMQTVLLISGLEDLTAALAVQVYA